MTNELYRAVDLNDRPLEKFRIGSVGAAGIFGPATNERRKDFSGCFREHPGASQRAFAVPSPSPLTISFALV